ncbi:MAG: GNAT family N-acetyltransferase [Solirubrobacterales bacterium]|nr:GNAT family N-acetyltransferase [Solirubrobacterales bacterium]
MEPLAELIEDRGAAASDAEFFRSPQFLEAEGTTHSLRITLDGSTLTAPIVVRQIEGTGHIDAISPYGYPGLRYEGEAGPPMAPSVIDFSATGLVSAFLRHSLGGEVPLTGATARNLCLLSDPAAPRKSRPSDRRQIRRNLELGYEVDFVAGPETDPEARGGFFRAYTDTMVRTDAAERYFFSEEYFELILSSEKTWLALARDTEGTIAAASIAAVSDGLMHYYLSGTADSHLRDSPMKNVIEAMIEFAAGKGLPLNLGGGISPGDPLEEFKRGFANREEQWFTSELVCDPATYEELSPAEAPEGFFPAYRA